MNLKKTIVRIFFFGILLGILIFIIGILFHLSKSTLFMALFISYIIFIIIVIPYQIRKRNLLNHKMELLLQQMYTGNIQEYITGMEQFLENADNNYLKSILTINMSIGYTVLGKFKKANYYLEQIDVNTIDKIGQMVLYHNVALNYFWSGEVKKACVIMELHQNLLQKGLQYSYLKNNFSETFALWYFARGKRQQAFAYLENVINDKTAKPLQKQAAEVIWAREKIADGEIVSSQQILQTVLSETNMPYLKKEAQNILNTLKQ